MRHSILNAIGNTPLVEIRNMNPNPRVKIFAKVEYFNPGGSIKDRTALFMIESGEKSGELTPEKTVIEATSGNTGIGLALVCAVKKYKLLLVMSEAASVERQQILKARGARILLTPGHLGTDGAIEEVYRLYRENPDDYFMTDQFNNAANWMAHYHGTAEEIWRQTGGKLDTVVATMGTTGTVMGISRRMKELDSRIQIIGVEPYLGHKIQGLKNMKEAYVPEIFEKFRLDHIVNIDDEDAYETARQLARQEGLFVGMSSGAAMFTAMEQARKMTGGTLVVVLPDNGGLYLSTPLFAVKEKVGLKLFNTMGRAKEPFDPLVPGKASVYSCGPTAHARMGLMECRRFVFSDLLCRYLEYRGLGVTHVMNITDLDDRTIDGSEKAGLDLKEFTEAHIQAFMADIKTLKIKPADHYPKASEHVDDMVKLSEKLVQKGYAYEKLRSLYFDISRFPDYGRLSGIDLDKIKLGATVDLDEYEKDNPRDFTLFKRTKMGELRRGIFTKTDWGNVRPSWHIQCAAMSMKYLGDTYDIHASGRELVFPHHENEIAIAKALTGKAPARYWIHCEGVRVDGKKPGGESEDRIALPDLMGLGYSGREIRYWLISSHYRKPLTFSKSHVDNAARGLARMDRVIAALTGLDNMKDAPSYPELDQVIYDIRNGFVSAMDDDLNISGAWAAIYASIRQVNHLISDRRINGGDAGKILGAFSQIDEVLQIFDFAHMPADPRIKALAAEREKARKEKNFQRADEIREQLRSMGVTILDRKLDETS